MPAGNDAILEAFADLLDQHGTDFVYSGDNETYTGLTGDGYSSSTVNMIQITPGQEFTVRFLASQFTPERMKKLTYGSRDFVITSSFSEIPGHGILYVTCRLQ